MTVVRLMMTLDEPSGPTADLSDDMPIEIAREIQRILIPIGLFRWDPARRVFGTGPTAGFHILRTEVKDDGEDSSGLD